MTREERRTEVKQIVHWILKADMYERSRDYSGSSIDVTEVACDHEKEMLWGSPLGWRVLIGIEGVGEKDANQKMYLKVYKADGTIYKESPVMEDAMGPFAWLEENLP
jgi:hypothetical protein